MRDENYKQYSQELDNQTKDAKNRVISFLEPTWNIEIREDDKEIDIFCKDKKTNKILFKIEMEVRFNWKSDAFPYNTVTIPYRKKKFFDENIPVFYFVLNEFGTTLYITSKENIINSVVIRKNTKYTINEPFYNVHLHHFRKGYECIVDYINDKLNDYSNMQKQTKLSFFC